MVYNGDILGSSAFAESEVGSLEPVDVLPAPGDHVGVQFGGPVGVFAFPEDEDGRSNFGDTFQVTEKPSRCQRS